MKSGLLTDGSFFQGILGSMAKLSFHFLIELFISHLSMIHISYSASKGQHKNMKR